MFSHLTNALGWLVMVTESTATLSSAQIAPAHAPGTGVAKTTVTGAQAKLLNTTAIGGSAQATKAGRGGVVGRGAQRGGGTQGGRGAAVQRGRGGTAPIGRAGGTQSALLARGATRGGQSNNQGIPKFHQIVIVFRFFQLPAS